MLLRKLVAAFCPLLLCAGICVGYRLIDGWLGSGAFFAFALKGVLLGAALGLALPIAGIRAYTNGLSGWLLLGAGVLLALLVGQNLAMTGAVRAPLLNVNGQVVLVESATMGYLACTGLLYRHC